MRGHEVAVRRLLATSRAEVAVPEPVVAEIVFGIERLPASRRRRELEARFALFRRELQVVPWTAAVSDHFGRVKAALEKRGTMIEDFDIAIAAHALAHGASLATANGKHLKRVPNLRVEDWTAK